MQGIRFKIEKGRIVDGKQRIADYFSSLKDGDFMLTVFTSNPLVTEEDYRAAYFKLIDLAVLESGNDKDTIHRSYKSHQKIASTKDFGIIEWKQYLENFKLWLYNNLNIIC